MDSHDRANYSAGKVIRLIFFLVFILVTFYFCKEIMKHTDGTIVTGSETDSACQNTEAQQSLLDAGINAIRCN